MNSIKKFKYTPPFMNKVVDKYFDVFNLYPKVKLEIWSFTPKVST